VQPVGTQGAAAETYRNSANGRMVLIEFGETSTSHIVAHMIIVSKTRIRAFYALVFVRNFHTVQIQKVFLY